MRLFRTSVVSVAPVLVSCPLRLLRSLRLPNGDRLHPCRLPRRVPMALAVAALMCTATAVPGQQRVATSRGRAAVASRGPARDAAAPLVLAGVTVIDVETGRRVPRQTVMIVGARITALGPTTTVRIPPGARVVDARGKFLIPGLWDMHVHPTDYTDVADPLYLANGVTGVRDAGSDVPLSTLTRWKQEIAAGTRVAPRLVVAGPSIQECGRARAPYNVCVSTPEEARLMVDILKEAGADFIKPREMSRELYFAIAREARFVGIPFGGHVPADTNGLEASDSGARFLDHSYYVDSCGDRFHPDTAKMDMAQCAADAQRLRRNNTWAVLTPFSRASYQREEYRRYLPAELLECQPRDSSVASLFRQAPAGPRPTSLAAWKAARLSWINDSATGSPVAPIDNGWGRLEAARVPILAATDAVLLPRAAWFVGLPGITLPEVLATMVAGGMTPLAALQTATVNPALALHATDSLGTVAAGKLADLVLLDADPLDDIWNTTKIRAVIANGRYFDRAALDQLLVQAEQAAHRPVASCPSGAYPSGGQRSGAQSSGQGH